MNRSGSTDGWLFHVFLNFKYDECGLTWAWQLLEWMYTVVQFQQNIMMTAVWNLINMYRKITRKPVRSWYSPSLNSPKFPQPIFLPTLKLGPTIRTPEELDELLERALLGFRLPLVLDFLFWSSSLVLCIVNFSIVFSPVENKGNMYIARRDGTRHTHKKIQPFPK